MSSTTDRSLRPASASDWPAVAALLEAHHLPTQGAREHLHHYVLAVSGTRVLGCAGLEVHGEDALLRSVAIAPGHQGEGLGQRLLARMLEEAAAQGVRTLYLLTTTAADYFGRLGFERLPIEAAPASLRASAEFQGACPANAIFMVRRLAA